MGVKNLWDVLEPCKRTLPLHHLQNKRVCVDLSCWMVQLQNVNKSYCAYREKVYLRGLFHRLRALIALNCKVIFVTDGAIPGIKLPTYRRRLNSGHEASDTVIQNGKNLENVSSCRRNMSSEFSCMIKEARLLGLALGIPCLDGVEEAEAQCALLNSESLCDGCFTSDSDIFLFGARTVYRDICLGEGGYIVCYEMADIESKLGFGRNSLITLALLLGCDYFEGVRGFGPESACQIVKSIGENVVLQQIASKGLAFIKRPRNSKKQGKPLSCNDKENSSSCEIDSEGSQHNPQTRDQILQVIDAYLKPKCHAADSDAVYRILAELPFQRYKLQQICHQFFGWPPEKTDEYILPKIAERNLHRFATLRSSSTRSGVDLPLHEMPVKCPVSEIIKRRKMRGRDCFEVSWDNIDGLKTSIVPVDLVQSACPEKIREFNEMKANKKKQHPRRPGQKKTNLMSEIDLRLLDLTLDVELKTTNHWEESVSESSSNDATHESTTEQRGSAASCHLADSCSSEREVIDLVSPSPLPRASLPFRTAGHRDATDQCVEVIDLSDSESDVSAPEHGRKARELRLCLSSVGGDMV